MRQKEAGGAFGWSLPVCHSTDAERVELPSRVLETRVLPLDEASMKGKGMPEGCCIPAVLQLSSQDLVVSEMGRSSSSCSASQCQIDSQERESNPPEPAYETGEQPLLPSCNASRLSQRTGHSYRFYDTVTAWSACLAAEARIRLRPRVRRGQPVEGWDSNPHLSDPQSDALPLSYLPHDDHDPPVGVEPTPMALQAMSFTVGYGGMNPGRGVSRVKENA